jgi:hypothetical protein
MSRQPVDQLYSEDNYYTLFLAQPSIRITWIYKGMPKFQRGRRKGGKTKNIEEREPNGDMEKARTPCFVHLLMHMGQSENTPMYKT